MISDLCFGTYQMVIEEKIDVKGVQDARDDTRCRDSRYGSHAVFHLMLFLHKFS